MTRPTRPLLRWALIASLAVNVLVAFALIGAVLGRAGRHGGPRGHLGGPPAIAALTSGLPQDRRDDLFRRLRRDGAVSDGRARMRAGEARIVAALRADPYEAEAFLSALQAQHDLQSELARHGLAELAAVVVTLDPEDRAALAERLGERRPRR